MPSYTPLVSISIPSIYNDAPLPARMARCTPDFARGLTGISSEIAERGHRLRLSDMYRSFDMQYNAHQDYLTGRKKAYSPPPGGSMHEAGRAMDIDLNSIGVPLSQFWSIASTHGFLPIIPAPEAARSESWHFDCRGSHDLVYQYVKSGKAGSGISPYAQMSLSGILCANLNTNAVSNTTVAYAQSALIRLGYDPGRIDGEIGFQTLKALRAAGCNDDAKSASEELSARLAAIFPAELALP